ncbi:MAG: hypothetical protein ACLGGX_01445 [Bdellovibrionia bacterium]
MKIATYLLKRSVLFCFCLLQGAVAYATDNVKRFPRDFWEFQVGTRYYYTNSNFTSSGGSFVGLPSGQYFQQTDFDLSTRYILGRNASVFGGVGFAMAESKDATTVRNNSNVRDAWVGAEYLMQFDNFEIVPEVELLIPLETYEIDTDSVMLTEGVFEIKPKITLQKEFDSYNGFVNFGFTYRDKNRSYLLPYGVGIEWKFRRSRLGVTFSGFASVTDDVDTPTKSDRTDVSDRVNGGSLYHYGVNPSLMETGAYYRFRVGGMWVAHVGGGISINGANMANGYYGNVMLRYSFDTSKWGSNDEPSLDIIPTVKPNKKSKMFQDQEPISTETHIKQFQEQYDDGVNQKLFRQPSPSVAPRLDEKKARPEVEVKLRQKKKAKPKSKK